MRAECEVVTEGLKFRNVAIVSKSGKVPEYAHIIDAGADVRAYYEDGREGIRLGGGETALIPTGLFIDVPPGYEMQVRPKSGLAAKNGITIPNAPGTIDAGYKDEVKVILKNTSQIPFYVYNNMRIAQLVLAPVIQAHFILKDKLDGENNRNGGFGSTGIS